MIATDFKGRRMVLLDNLGHAVRHETVYRDFRGEQYTIVDAMAPHKPGAAGYVEARSVDQHPEVRGGHEYYVTVFDFQWVHESALADTNS